MRNHSIRALGKAAIGLAAGLGFCVSLVGVETSGYVKREFFLAPGAGTPTTVPPFAGNPKYPDSPDSVTYLDSWVSEQTANPNVDDYGGRLSGYIIPATTDDYVFFIHSDDNGAFYLSTDSSPANLKLVATESVWSNARQWQNSGGASSLANKRSDKYAATQWPGGGTIHLVAGQKYYAEMLWKEGGGGDDGGVTMIRKGDVVDADPVDDPTGGVPAFDDPSTLTGALISVDAPTALGFLKQPVSQTILENRPVTFAVIGVTPPGDPLQDPTQWLPGITYQWKKNGTDIPWDDVDGDGNPDAGSSGTATYTIPLVKTADNGAKFTCVISTPGGLTSTSAEAILTVSTDSVAPTLAKVTGSATFKSVTITFSEAVDASAATYSLSGGLTVGTVTIQSPTQVFIESSLQTEGTAYTLTVNNVKDLAGNALTANTAPFTGYVFKLGLVQYGTWQNEPGPFTAWEDGDAEGNPVKDKPPTTLAFKTLFEANTADEYENYFGQLKGYFIPSVSGNYVFYMSSDDHGELYLSTDADPANKKLIAQESSWSNRRIWLSDGVNDNTATRGVDGELVNRSDQFIDTLWPTGSTITLTADTKYYIELLFLEGGGGDNGGATFKLASAADPANGTPSAITGNVVGTYVDPNTLPPVITTRPTGVTYSAGETISFSVVADPATANYQWYKSKKAISGATSATLTIPNAGAADVGDYYVVVSTANGSASSFPDNDSRAVMKGAYVIEVEDYNYDSGKTLPAASVMPLQSDLYVGKDGIPGIDFHLVAVSTAGDPAHDALPEENGNSYRNGWLNNGTPVPFPTTPEPLGNIDVILENGNGGAGPDNRVRPDYTLTNNYKIGWGTPGEWYQYTRDFPEGDYTVVAAYSRDGRTDNAYGLALEVVTGDPTKVNAAATVVGEITASGTGAWSSNDLMPFSTPGAATPASVALKANTTLRLRLSQNDPDIDYLLFYKTGTPPTGPTLSSTYVNGVLTLTYTGTLEGSATIDGDFNDVAGAVSPFTVPYAAAVQLYRSHD